MTAPSAAAPVQLPGQSTPAPGIAAPVRATRAIHPAGQPPHHATASANGIATGAAARARNPNTVAGAIAASTSRLQGIATRLTRADSTATTGAHSACAAPAAASASAIRGGTP